MVVRARGPVQDVLWGRVVRLLDPVEAGQLALVLCVPDQVTNNDTSTTFCVSIVFVVAYTAS